MGGLGKDLAGGGGRENFIKIFKCRIALGKWRRYCSPEISLWPTSQPRVRTSACKLFREPQKERKSYV